MAIPIVYDRSSLEAWLAAQSALNQLGQGLAGLGAGVAQAMQVSKANQELAQVQKKFPQFFGEAPLTVRTMPIFKSIIPAETQMASVALSRSKLPPGVTASEAANAIKDLVTLYQAPPQERAIGAKILVSKYPALAQADWFRSALEGASKGAYEAQTKAWAAKAKNLLATVKDPRKRLQQIEAWRKNLSDKTTPELEQFFTEQETKAKADLSTRIYGDIIKDLKNKSYEDAMDKVVALSREAGNPDAAKGLLTTILQGVEKAEKEDPVALARRYQAYISLALASPNTKEIRLEGETIPVEMLIEPVRGMGVRAKDGSEYLKKFPRRTPLGTTRTPTQRALTDFIAKRSVERAAREYNEAYGKSPVDDRDAWYQRAYDNAIKDLMAVLATPLGDFTKGNPILAQFASFGTSLTSQGKVPKDVEKMVDAYAKIYVAPKLRAYIYGRK